MEIKQRILCVGAFCLAASVALADKASDEKACTRSSSKVCDEENMHRARCPRDPEKEPALIAILERFQLEEVPPPHQLPQTLSIEPAIRVGMFMYLSGRGPERPLPPRPGPPDFFKGKVVDKECHVELDVNCALDGPCAADLKEGEISLEQAVCAAQLTALTQLAVLKQELGSLKKVTRVVKVFGMVNSDDPAFSKHSDVINGASDVFISAFGDCGRHARSAVGMASLPFGIPVEIEMVVKVR